MSHNFCNTLCKIGDFTVIEYIGSGHIRYLQIDDSKNGLIAGITPTFALQLSATLLAWVESLNDC